MAFVKVKEKGSLLILFKFKQELAGKLESISDENHLLYDINDYIMRVPFNNENELKNILTSFSTNLSHQDKKDLLVSFSSENDHEVFNNIVSLYALIQTYLHNEVIDLIKYGDLFSVMQPIYNIQNQSLYGYEFLLRGKIDGKIISPVEIFDTATEVGLQYLLDARARELSIQKASTLNHQDLKIFINFLPSCIHNQEYNLLNTFQVASSYDVSLSNLVFEVVETENVENFHDLNNEFIVYKQKGTTLAIDDVGSGYSSLNKLHQLVPDYVKIDRGLVSYCDINEEKFKIIKSIVELCKSLNILVLAEGIEREEELEVCLKLGVNLGQGYLLGKPSEEPVSVSYFSK